MDQKSDEIKRRIDTERSQLTHNVYEIESRLKEASDWRQQFNKNPMLGVGLAFAGGLLLSAVAGGSSKSGSVDRSSQPSLLSAPLNRFAGALDAMVGAFGGLAASKIEEVIAGAVPGFRDQLDKFIPADQKFQRRA